MTHERRVQGTSSRGLRGKVLGGTLATLLLATLVLSQSGCAARSLGAGPRGAAAKAGAKGDFKPWAEVTKKAEKIDGFFTLYKKPDKIYFAIEEAQLGKEFLGISSFARGIGSSFLLGGLPLNDRLLEFRRVGNEVLLLDKNVRFTAPKGTAYEQALDLSHGHSVLAKIKIESVHDSSKALLVDMTDVLVNDLPDLSTWARQGLNNRPVKFDKERSSLAQVKNFPKNTEIEALLTFTPDRRTTGFLIFWSDPTLYTVPDQRYIPITVHYSFVELPEVPMKPRFADDRVGYFLTVKKDFSHDSAEDFFVRMIDRWRLEKKDPTADVSEPVKPIVYYVDRTVPDQYRPWVKAGIEKWQKAFEAAGFKNAIIAKDAPSEEEDPDWDAEDARYSTIRWITSGGNSFNGIGPHRTDPRTGEILDADILIEAIAMQRYRTSWRKYAGPADMVAELMPKPKLDGPIPLELICENQTSAAVDGALMRATLLFDGAMPPGSPVPDEYLEPFVIRLIMHEVGHTLGLRHNFRSSTATPYDKLQDVAWTSQNGLMGSVMDYVTPNISRDRSKQGEYFISTPGTYDLFAIRYGYTPSGEDHVEDDHAFAMSIADESSLPGHEYGSDHDAYAPNALDPRTQRWDLSDDPLRWAADRSAYLQDLWRNGKLEERILGEDSPYPVLRNAMNTLIFAYGRTCAYAVKYFGGQYHVRDHRGQNGGHPPLTPVPAEKQREAMEFLSKQAFAADAFDVSPELLNRLAPDRWTHWGQPSGMSPATRLDYDQHARALAMQTFILGEMLDPGLLNRLHEAENRAPNAYRLSEYMNSLTRALWGEVGSTAGPGMRKLEEPNTRRDLQRTYVDMLATMVVDPAPGTPDDARALARLQLQRISGRAARGLTATGLGDYTRAHLMEARARIERALNAERETSG